MFLTSSDEVVEYVGSAIEGALRAPGRRDSRRLPTDRLRLGLIDPDCVLLVDCGSAEVRLGNRGEVGVTGVLAMAGDTAVGLCRGQVDLAAALASGEIVVDGAGGVLLDLLAGIHGRELVAAG